MMGGPVSLKKNVENSLRQWILSYQILRPILGFGQRWESPWVMGKGGIPTGKKQTCLSCLDFEAIAVTREHFFGFVYLSPQEKFAVSWSTFKNCRQRMNIVVSSNDTRRKN